jgi:hypothetical protein
MGFRARRSLKIAPGIRLNISTKSVGVSMGGRGARVTVNSSGRVTRTVGVPGTGISHTRTTSSAKRSSGAASRPQSPPITAPKPRAIKPGLMAPAWEKQLFKQLSAPDATAIHGIGQQNPPITATAAMVEVLVVSGPSRDIDRSRTLLTWLFGTGYDPSTDAFITKYIEDRSITIPIAAGITVQTEWDREALGLLAAELEQAAGNHSTAINIVEQLEPTTIAAVSLAELYAEEGRWSDVIDLTNGLTNEDVAATFLLIQRGTALRESGYFDAAREALKEALRPRSRPSELRHLALIARGHTFLAEGKKSLARKDFERVLADDAAYPGLRELLAEDAS